MSFVVLLKTIKRSSRLAKQDITFFAFKKQIPDRPAFIKIHFLALLKNREADTPPFVLKQDRFVLVRLTSLFFEIELADNYTIVKMTCI